MKLQFLIIFFYCVYYVFGESSFIPKGKRAEIFELTDNEIPVFRVTLPDEEFITLKSKADISRDNEINQTNAKSGIEILNQTIIKIVEVLNRQDFNKVFPGYDFKEILPELPMDENGHPTVNYENYLIDFNVFIEINPSNEIEFYQGVFSRSSLNLIHVFEILYNLDMSSEADDELFLAILHVLGNTNEILKTYVNENEKVNENEQVNENVYENLNENQYPENRPNYESENENNPIYDYFGYFYNYDVQNFDIDEWNFDSPSAASYYDAPSSAWDSDTPSSAWDSDMPSSAWDSDDDTPSLLQIIINYLWGKENESHSAETPTLVPYNDDIYYPSIVPNDDDDIYYPTPTINENDTYSTDETTDYFEKLFYDTFSTKNFYKYFKNYNFDKKNEFENNLVEKEYEFKTKNATMIVEINNEKKAFEKVTFSLGGSYSRSFSKPGYNLKIRGGDELYGRRQFKLRGDASEPSYMRTKLVSDIRNRIGMPSLSANYATLYINDEYFGLFILTDAYKESWIEYVYGEKDTQQLYKCEYCDLTYETRSGFVNENKEATNRKELYKFLVAMTSAKTASDVESIFDLDQYYKEIAVDLLTSSWDHTLHNFYVYKNKNKWIYLSHDYDLDMGMSGAGPSYRINNYASPIHKKLIHDDDRRFREILKEIVGNVFNPATLYPHIDEIKSFIRPYVKLDKTPDEHGYYPGRINKYFEKDYTFEQWEDSTEFKSVNIDEYALKKFILLKYRIICKDYELECDPVYLDMHYGRSALNANSTVTEDDESSIDLTLDDNKKDLVDIENLENADISDTTEVADNGEYDVDLDIENETSSSDEEEEIATSDATTSF